MASRFQRRTHHTSENRGACIRPCTHHSFCDRQSKLVSETTRRERTTSYLEWNTFVDSHDLEADMDYNHQRTYYSKQQLSSSGTADFISDYLWTTETGKLSLTSCPPATRATAHADLQRMLEMVHPGLVLQNDD
jgi:hypothetical protein